mgnify:CR=1 FL=1
MGSSVLRQKKHSPQRDYIFFLVKKYLPSRSMLFLSSLFRGNRPRRAMQERRFLGKWKRSNARKSRSPELCSLGVKIFVAPQGRAKRSRKRIFYRFALLLRATAYTRHHAVAWLTKRVSGYAETLEYQGRAECVPHRGRRYRARPNPRLPAQEYNSIRGGT